VFADAVARVRGSIFPIFHVPPDWDPFAVKVSGTGFFVDGNGLFLTVHRVMAAVPGSRMFYYGNVPDQVCEPVEFECVAVDMERDLYLGRVQRDYAAPVQLSMESARVGDCLCVGGYPMATLTANSRGGMVGNVRPYWQPTFVIDSADVAIDRRSYAGYLVQHPCLRGTCGGPVFDTSGKVRGIAATTLARRIVDPCNNANVLHNGVVIDVEHIRDFVEAYRF
jgi:S1-C subfamily serine protease